MFLAANDFIVYVCTTKKEIMKKVWVSPVLNDENLTKTLGGNSTTAVEATAAWCS